MTTALKESFLYRTVHIRQLYQCCQYHFSGVDKPNQPFTSIHTTLRNTQSKLTSITTTASTASPTFVWA
jgi:hypothetical protein